MRIIMETRVRAIDEPQPINGYYFGQNWRGGIGIQSQQLYSVPDTYYVPSGTVNHLHGILTNFF